MGSHSCTAGNDCSSDDTLLGGRLFFGVNVDSELLVTPLVDLLPNAEESNTPPWTELWAESTLTGLNFRALPGGLLNAEDPLLKVEVEEQGSNTL